MKNYENRDWDTAFFGFRVAAITVPQLSERELTGLLEKLRHRAVTLVYWPAANDPAMRELGLKLGGFLADEKTRYHREFAELTLTAIPPTPQVARYESSSVSPDL